MRHEVEDLTDAQLAAKSDETISLYRVQLAANVISIQTELGDRFRNHTNGQRMAPEEWNKWRQSTKRALSHQLRALLRVKREIGLRMAAKKAAQK